MRCLMQRPATCSFPFLLLVSLSSEIRVICGFKKRLVGWTGEASHSRRKKPSDHLR